MRINGELYLGINAFMDFLCLTLTAALSKRRLRPGRMILSSLLGGIYSLFAWLQGPWLRSVPLVLLTALLMTITAFGKPGIALWPLTVSAGWFFAGASSYLLQSGCAPAVVILLCGGLCCALAAALRRASVRGGAEFQLQLTLSGRTVTLSGFRDTGNLLRDGCTGLPVIVAPEGLLRPLLPPQVRCGDLSTLPRGWRLVRAQTAAGEKCLMCFLPDRLCLIRGRSIQPLRAAVAIADYNGSRALLPDALFMQEEGRIHADH